MRRELTIIFTIWYRDLLHYKRNWPRMISSLMMPLLWLVIFGSGMSSSMGGAFDSGNIDYIKFMFPGIIGMSLLFTSIFSALTIVTDREFGFLKEMLVAPISRHSIAIGKTLGGATTAFLQALIMLILAPFLGLKISLVMILQLLPAMFLVAFALTSLGVFLASKIDSHEGFQMVMQFIMMPMFFLSGGLFPIRNLPKWMDILVKINPATYSVDLVRQIVLKAQDIPQIFLDMLTPSIGNYQLYPSLDMAIVLIFATLMIGLAVRGFAKSN